MSVATRHGSAAVSPAHAYAAALSGQPCRLLVDGREATWDAERWLGTPDAFALGRASSCA
jgi:hypothetical protein